MHERQVFKFHCCYFWLCILRKLGNYKFGKKGKSLIFFFFFSVVSIVLEWMKEYWAYDWAGNKAMKYNFNILLQLCQVGFLIILKYDILFV